jgi:hypothetical protein
VDRSRDAPSVHVDRIVPIEEARRTMAQGVLVRLCRVEGDVLERLRRQVEASSGPLPLVLEFRPDADTLARVKAGPLWTVAPTDALVERLGSLPEVTGWEFLARAP